MPGPPDPLRIIFLGTPEFAVPALEALARSRHRVELVVTQPDRPKGRGRKLAPTPVKLSAQKLSCEVVQPETVKDDAFGARIARLKPDALAVVAFGQLLPETLLNMAPLGAVNIHPSLLPLYRGSAPIPWAIINGDRRTGVTTMRLDTGMDTGDILLARETPIADEDTAQTLHDRLADIGAALLVETLDGLAMGTISPQPQDHSRASLAPMLKKADGRIDWRQPARVLNAFVRGMTPWPGAFTFWQKKRLKIFKTRVAPPLETAPPGTVLKAFSDELRVATGDGALSILEIQGDSGKRMAIKDYLRGRPIPAGAVLGPAPDAT